MEIKTKQETKKKATFDVVDHPPFPGDMKTCITTTIDLTQTVSKLFAPAFPDYVGCNILMNDGSRPVIAQTMPYGTVYVNLFFKDNGEAPEGMKKNIILSGSSDDNRSIGDRIVAMSGRTAARAYEVTAATYEMLEEFMPNGSRTRWMNHTNEITSQMSPYGKEEIFVEIAGLELNRIITKIYGAKTDEGRYEYQTTASTIMPNKNREFIVQIAQLDLKAVRDLQNALGIYGANAPMFHQAR